MGWDRMGWRGIRYSDERELELERERRFFQELHYDLQSTDTYVCIDRYVYLFPSCAHEYSNNFEKQHARKRWKRMDGWMDGISAS